MDRHRHLPRSSAVSGMPRMCHVFDSLDMMPSSALFVPDFDKAPPQKRGAPYCSATASPSSSMSSASCPRDDASTPACSSPASQYDDQHWAAGNTGSAPSRRHSSFSSSPDHPYQPPSPSAVAGLYSSPTHFPSLPPSTCSATHVQPPGGGLQIRVLGAPDKSRVETQARLCIQLLTGSGTKVSHWSYLKLPERLLSRSRLKRAVQQQQQQQRVASSTPPSSPDGVNGILLSDESQVLHLDARVVCATQPDQPVYVCSACIQRERKRAERSKSGSNHSARTLLDIPEQDRILLFNCGPMVNFTSGDAILPTRIACYCRHHNEKVGFRIHFSMRDHRGNVIATGISPPILITDDHKSSRQKKASTAASSPRPPPTRKRARTSSAAAAADDDDVPPLDTHMTPHIDPAPTPTPASPDDTLSPTMLHSAPSSALPTPCDERRLSSLFDPSCCNDDIAPCLLPQQPHSLDHHPAAATTPFISPSLLQQQHPQLDRLVPAHGPTYGGMEVTILGSGFYRGISVLFGEHPATTIYWNPNTLVCMLPPAVHPGSVVVSFKEHSVVLDRPHHPADTRCLSSSSTTTTTTTSSSTQHNQVSIFTYQDANDNALLELALQVVGLKSTGKLQDAKKIAMQIVQQAGDPTFMTPSAAHQ